MVHGTWFNRRYLHCTNVLQVMSILVLCSPFINRLKVLACSLSSVESTLYSSVDCILEPVPVRAFSPYLTVAFLLYSSHLYHPPSVLQPLLPPHHSTNCMHTSPQGCQPKSYVRSNNSTNSLICDRDRIIHVGHFALEEYYAYQHAKTVISLLCILNSKTHHS